VKFTDTSPIGSIAWINSSSSGSIIGGGVIEARRKGIEARLTPL
jgi:hypothetical protein